MRSYAIAGRPTAEEPSPGKIGCRRNSSINTKGGFAGSFRGRSTACRSNRFQNVGNLAVYVGPANGFAALGAAPASHNTKFVRRSTSFRLALGNPLRRFTNSGNVMPKCRLKAELKNQWGQKQKTHFDDGLLG